ncbi:SCO1860 family LAETG-anchored protein [Streptomyces sp. NPDC048664]|uniref:SCO1860 family LAETG-anchored protein n=1 Tax=Streptomyces sp. NPDC048664 TaxID=3154505 RepID=UPI0034205BA6
MNGITFRMPARRLTTVALATVLAAGPAALAGAGPAAATGGHGSASAFVLRTGLDVSLADKALNIPLAVSLNEVQAPRSAQRTALSARLDGVAGGRPFDVVRASAADAKATVSSDGAEASTRLADARVHLPGMPMLPLIEVEGVTSKAVCAPGKTPVATSDVLGAVTVLGHRVTATAGGPMEVKVPGVGEVRAEVSPTRVVARTAAASSLVLTVSLNPLNLNVARIKGTVTLAGARCEAPEGSGAPEPGTATAPDVKPQGAPAKEADTPAEPAAAPAQSANLAETGGGSATPYIVAGAIALLAVGAGAVGVARRRRG